MGPDRGPLVLPLPAAASHSAPPAAVPPHAALDAAPVNAPALPCPPRPPPRARQRTLRRRARARATHMPPGIGAATRAAPCTPNRPRHNGAPACPSACRLLAHPPPPLRRRRSSSSSSWASSAATPRPASSACSRAHGAPPRHHPPARPRHANTLSVTAAISPRREGGGIRVLPHAETLVRRTGFVGPQGWELRAPSRESPRHGCAATAPRVPDARPRASRPPPPHSPPAGGAPAWFGQGWGRESVGT